MKHTRISKWKSIGFTVTAAMTALSLSAFAPVCPSFPAPGQDSVAAGQGSPAAERDSLAAGRDNMAAGRDSVISNIPRADIEARKVPVTYAPAASEYDNKAVANVKDVLNLRAEPSLDGKILGKCYRGAGGVILDKKDGWTKIRSGGLEGWLKNDYLVFGQDIKPLAKELGLFTAKVTTQTLNVRKEPTTDSVIVGLAAADDYYPVLEEKDGWAKIHLSSDTSGYISTDYTKISLTPGKAVSIEAEQAALKAADKAQSQKKKEAEKPKYVIHASDDEIYLMAACVMMESGGYSYDGQLAVANVIVNRVKSGRWGKSITDVIYAQGQFPGATSGLLDKYLTKGPSSSVLKATKAALSGTNNIGDYLFFNSVKSADYGSYSTYTVVDGNCFYKK